MKKKLFLLAIPSLIAALFTSCNDKNSSGSKNTLTEIEIWYSPYTSDVAPLPDDSPIYKAVETQLGIKLKTVPLPVKKDEQNEKIIKAAKANSLPDFFMTNRDILVQLVKANQVARVEKMYNVMPERTAKMYDTAAQNASKFDGLAYGLSQSGAIDRNEGILIRKDWLDNLALPIPVTTEDFFDVMMKFTFNDPDKNGKNDTYGFGAYLEINNREEGLGTRFAPFFGAFGVAGTFNASKNDPGLNIRKPAYFNALQYIQSIVAAKIIDPNWLGYSKDDFRNAWKEGRFGIMREQNAAYALEANYKKFDENFPDGEWILIDPPVGPNAESSVGCYTSSYRTYAVSRRAGELGKLPAIARLLEWMTTDGYNMVAYGREGVNFLLDAEGNVTTDGLEDPEQAYTKTAAAPYLQLRNIVFYGGDEELSARYPSWTTINGRKMSALTVLREMQKKPWTQSVGIPSPDAELKKFMRQGVQDFVTGKRSLTWESWTDWLEEFDRRGGEEWERQSIEQAMANNQLIDTF
ncbi:ABC transporter substrate-binding protein [Treponema zioleckii]|uniref:ABC transporter substrate-binding protein n=1 Tax=Treponema zioleckii TaxID=331680 RepID=UPI00168B19D8|nr:ABC transporter substrate-binding protein [Treponema zioleckii]